MWVSKLHNTGSVVKRADPYHNPIFPVVLHSLYFKTPKLLGRKSTKPFLNSLPDGELSEVEVPPAMLSLIATAVC